MRNCPKCGAEYADTDFRTLCGYCMSNLQAAPAASAGAEATDAPNIPITVTMPEIAMPAFDAVLGEAPVLDAPAPQPAPAHTTSTAEQSALSNVSTMIGERIASLQSAPGESPHTETDACASDRPTPGGKIEQQASQNRRIIVTIILIFSITVLVGLWLAHLINRSQFYYDQPTIPNSYQGR